MANTMMRKFWDSALDLEPPDDCDNHSEMSMLQVYTLDETELGRDPSLGLGSSFAYKFVDQKGHVLRLDFGTNNLGELTTAVMQRLGAVNDQDRPQLLYEDDEGYKVLLATDEDLIGAVGHARLAGLKVLRLHLDYSELNQQKERVETRMTKTRKTGWPILGSGVLVGAVAMTGVSVLVYLKRSNQ